MEFLEELNSFGVCWYVDVGVFDMVV